MDLPFTIATQAEGLIIVVHYMASFDVVDHLPALKTALNDAFVQTAQQHGTGFVVAIIHDMGNLTFSLNEIRYGIFVGFDMPVADDIPKPEAIHTYIVTESEFIAYAVQVMWRVLSMVGVSVRVFNTLNDAIRDALAHIDTSGL